MERNPRLPTGETRNLDLLRRMQSANDRADEILAQPNPAVESGVVPGLHLLFSESSGLYVELHDQTLHRDGNISAKTVRTHDAERRDGEVSITGSNDTYVSWVSDDGRVTFDSINLIAGGEESAFKIADFFESADIEHLAI